MATIYRRGDSPNWWLSYVDEHGKRRQQSAETNNEEVARGVLEGMVRAVEARRTLGLKTPGPVTVRQWFLKWMESRRILTVKEQRVRTERDVLPILGDMPLTQVRPRHIREVTRAAEKRGLSSRSVMLVYSDMRSLFRAAVKEDLIPASPCLLSVRDGDLPSLQDAEHGWRETAIFTRGEAEALISDPRLLEVHRVLWALLFLGAMRIGEAVDRRWRDVDYRSEPLPKLTINSRYNDKRKTSTAGTKTGVTRYVPVLPQLGAILEAWRDGGGREAWVAQKDRAWRNKKPAEDIIVPGPRGGILSPNTSWRWLQDDCALLDIRPRRQHDTRRTFVSLARADGARTDIVDLVAWGREHSVRGLYTDMPWATVCEEIAKLKLGPTLQPVTQHANT